MDKTVGAQMELITGHRYNIIMTNFSKFISWDRTKHYKEEKDILVFSKDSFH